jgi:N-acetylglucosaminyl-diphospho-decaprenol L-rhamnosyltransferase
VLGNLLSMEASRQLVSVVVATRNRRETLLTTLAGLSRLPEQPPLVVVDNDSDDGTVAMVREHSPETTVIELPTNRGAVARNIGVLAAKTPFVAFADDDSVWTAGSLARASFLLDAYPRLALIAARILVGEAKREDPTCEAMARSPLRRGAHDAGIPVFGFLACGSVVRRNAFLDVGGFSERLWFAGEESLLAIDLVSAGWHVNYCPEVIARHSPSPKRDGGARAVLQARNRLWVAWLRRPPRRAVQETLGAARRAVRDPIGREALAAALRELGPVLRERRPVSAEIESALVAIERSATR